MLFNPMWDNEIERIGCKKCSLTAYALYQLADWCSIAGAIWLCLIGLTPVQGGAWFAAVLWLAGRIMYKISRNIVRRRGFTYNRDADAAIWQGRDGTPQRYTLEDYEREYPAPHRK
ncbi:MAG: hypothetical protein Q3966_10025 [Neisseria sp.]|nr:hypothetical protein [Neisseria sp.]